MKLKYIKELDSIRGLAALSIMWLHFAGTITPSGSVSSFFMKTASVFQTGVPLFFVLSGFLITRILLNSKSDTNYFSSFYMRRALRIFPLYYFVLLLAYTLLPVLMHYPLPAFGDIWASLLYLQNFAITFHWRYTGPPHIWSLAVEEHFYLIWPMLLYYCSTKNLKRILIIVIIAEPVLRYMFEKNGIDSFYFTFTRLDELCIGSLLAIRELEGKIISKKEIGVVATLLLGGVAAWMMLTGQRLLAVQVLKYSFFAVIFYLVIGIVALNQIPIVNRLLSHKPLFYIGRISYGLYLYHPFCYALAEYYLRGNHSEVIRFFACFGGTFAVSSLSYYLFELRFLKLKKYFDRKVIVPVSTADAT